LKHGGTEERRIGNKNGSYIIGRGWRNATSFMAVPELVYPEIFYRSGSSRYFSMPLYRRHKCLLHPAPGYSNFGIAIDMNIDGEPNHAASWLRLALFDFSGIDVLLRFGAKRLY
jgi:hypothetical protein